MAVLAIFAGPGLTKELYESLRREVNWERDLPAGGLFHAAGFDEKGGIHVADVWASPEEMEAFVGKRLMPAFQKLRIPPPSVEVFPLHNATAYPAVERFRPAGR